MLHRETYADVTRIVFSSPISRAFGYDVSVFVTHGVMIDTAFPGARAEMDGVLRALPVNGVVVTHHHEDHAGNVGLMARRGVPVAAAAATLAALHAHEPIGAVRRAIWGTPVRLESPPAPFAPHHLVLVPTPGHSADHHVVWDAERETLFAGDLFLGVKVRMAHPEEDPRALARSLRLAASLEPRRMFDAHRGLVPKPATALRRKAEWLEETIANVERRLAQGWSDRAAARAVLGRERPQYYLSFGALSAINFVRAVRRRNAEQVSGTAAER